MEDPILADFLRTQLREARALEAASDLLRIAPLPGDPPQAYIIELRCRGLVRHSDGEIHEADRFVAGIRFPDDYLRRVDPYEVITLLEPAGFFHPNAAGPAICLGRIGPRTRLVDLIYQTYELIVAIKATVREDDCLNPAAAAWYRDHREILPIDRRPLKRPSLALGGTRDT